MSLPLQLISAKRAFDPRSLFAGGVNGIFLNPAVTSSVFQDTAAATPAVPTDPIGRINDQSGNGNNATQSTSTRRPIYTLGSGHYSFELDSVDDVLSTSAGAGATSAFTAVVACRVDGGATEYVLYGSSGNNGFRVLTSTIQRLQVQGYDGASASSVTSGINEFVNGTPFILSVWYDGTKLNMQVNNGTVYSTSPFTLAAGSSGLSIGATSTGSLSLTGGFYGLIYVKNSVVSSANREACKAYLAARAGVTL